MDITILDSNLVAAGVLDSYESLIWNECYLGTGDFEIYSSANTELLNLCKIGNYLYRRDADMTMIIESIKIQTDIEAGSKITITGRSLESILERRIVWGQVNISGSVQEAIKKLLYDSIIEPSIVMRKIDNFMFEETDDPEIVNLNMEEAQFDGETIMEAITKICEVFKIGFKVYLNEENKFVFKLYKGKDRSYRQSVLPYVVFSPNFGNLLNSDFKVDRSTLRNVVYIAGEGEGVDRKNTYYGEEEGLERRELFYKSSKSSKVDNKTLSDSEYYKVLTEDGKQKLTECKTDQKFEGSADVTELFIFGKDFFMGDVLQVSDEYGNEARSRVTKLVTSHDSSGINIYPSFEIEEEEDNAN